MSRKMYDMIIGIDPGKEGALCALDFRTGKLLHKLAMPSDIRPKYGWLLLFQDAKVFVALEQAIGAGFSGRKMSAPSMFTYGREFGHIECAIALSGFPYALVPPAKWTKVMHEGTYGSDPKDKSSQAAHRLWPREDFLLSPKARIPHKGQIDAMLIAEYYRRKLTSGDKND